MGLRGIGAKTIKPTLPSKLLKVSSRGKTRAERVINFIQSLPITSGMLAGKRFKLGPWQKDIIKAIYREKSGRRIVRQALITIPRKNGKTTFAAALALCHLCGPERENRGEIYSAANERNQASIIYREMKAMIQATDLQDRVIIRDWAKSLECAETGSIYVALSADVETKHGFSASFWIYDELGQAPNRRLYDVLSTSGGARSEPLGVIISTQSGDPHSIMSELVDDGERLLAGEFTDSSFYPVIYQAPIDADPWSEQTWLDCNPAIKSGFRSLDEMRIMARQAQRIPAREAAFRLLYLNQRVQTEAKFIPLTAWDQCGGVVDYDALKGRLCFGGLDLSTTTDLTALVLVFPPVSEGERFILMPFFWLPADMLDERSRKDRLPFDLWAKDGFLTATPGNLVDYAYVIKRLRQCREDFQFKALSFDRWGSQKIIVDLADLGFSGDEKEVKAGATQLIQFGQGFASMSSPTKELLNMVLGGRINHGGHPVLRANANAATVETDAAGNMKPSKKRARERIDGIVAAIMGLDSAIRQPKPKGSIYDQGGLFMVG